MKIIKISAIWCGACIVMNKIWKDVKNDFSDIEIEELDLDFDEEEVKQYNVGDTLPVLIFMDDSIEKDRLVGEKTKEEVYSFIERNR